MAGRRGIYLTGLGICLGIWGLYRNWLAWILLQWLLWLPVLSLAVSLPGILLTKLHMDVAAVGLCGKAHEIRLKLRCPLPVVPFRVRFRLRELCTGERRIVTVGESWVPNHCGAWELRLHRCYLYDYLGLIRIPGGRRLSAAVYIEPKPVEMALPDWVAGSSPRVWKPKPGGGFAENHDLRLYRPGDNLQHIHWKMVAKTGKLILREPVEPAEEVPAVLLTLPGDADLRDMVLGKLLWVGRLLLEKEERFRLCCLTGAESWQEEISGEQDLKRQLHRLLTMPGAAPGSGHKIPVAGRVLKIGGDADEA